MALFRRTPLAVEKIPLFLVLAGALVGIGMNAFATVVRTESHIPISHQIFDPKTNEQLLLTDAEIVVQVSSDETGGGQVTVVGSLHGTGKGNSGIDYLFSGGGKRNFNNSGLPLTEFGLLCDVQLTPRDGSNSQQVMILLGITVNAAGQANVVFRDAIIHSH